MKKIKVLVVDDSPVFRRFIIEGLKKVDYIEVVGYAYDPVDAEGKINTLKPDVISCDVEMPRMDGITFVKKLMKENPTRVVIVSALNISVFDAISAGAIDFVRKPIGASSDANEKFIADLADKILIASQAKLRISKRSSVEPSTKSVINKLRNTTSTIAGINSSLTAAASSAPVRTGIGIKPATASADTAVRRTRSRCSLIAMGASTGGTEALLEVVKDLPVETPGIVIVQHMPAGFTKMYADRLNRTCKMEVREAKNGDKVRPGLILVAPGDLQMSVVRTNGEFSVRCVPGNKVSGHRPSVDVLFSSVAKVACPDCMGVILTGMGSDGSKGMLEMKEKGAYTIGQDEESCVVYGMPMVAYNMGAVEKQAPLESIAGIILSRLSK